jgi:ankyrin repeat protein
MLGSYLPLNPTLSKSCLCYLSLSSVGVTVRTVQPNQSTKRFAFKRLLLSITSTLETVTMTQPIIALLLSLVHDEPFLKPIIFFMLEKGNTPLRKLTLSGSNVNQLNPLRNKTIFVAYITDANCDEEIVDKMLQLGANVSLKAPSGEFVLHSLAKLPDSDKTLRLIRRVIEAGANVNAKDEEGNTPLHVWIGMLHY